MPHCHTIMVPSFPQEKYNSGEIRTFPFKNWIFRILFFSSFLTFYNQLMNINVQIK